MGSEQYLDIPIHELALPGLAAYDLSKGKDRARDPHTRARRAKFSLCDCIAGTDGVGTSALGRGMETPGSSPRYHAPPQMGARNGGTPTYGGRCVTGVDHVLNRQEFR